MVIEAIILFLSTTLQVLAITPSPTETCTKITCTMYAKGRCTSYRCDSVSPCVSAIWCPEFNYVYNCLGSGSYTVYVGLIYPRCAYCGQCALGYRFSGCTGSPTKLLYDDHTCTACEAGKYSDSGYLTACTPCPLGTYNTNTAQSSCQKCPVGYSNSGTGLTSCFQCTNDDMLNIAGCQCPSGFYNKGDVYVNCTPCSPCDQGYTFSGCAGNLFYDDSVCTPCGVGEYLNNSNGYNKECTPCEAGTYNNDVGQSSCNVCNHGFYNLQIGQSNCTECTINEITQGIIITCACPVGFWNDAGICKDCTNAV